MPYIPTPKVGTMNLSENVVAEQQPKCRRRRNTKWQAVPASWGMNKEPVREWSFGIITGYRVRLIVSMVVVTSGLYFLQELLWPIAEPADTLPEKVWSYGSFLWLAAVIPGVMAVIGLLMFRQPDDLDAVRPIPQRVSWRIVTLGSNIEALTATIRRCQREMSATSLFDYVIEVVTEAGTHIDELPLGEDIFYIVVPADYRTKNGSLFKARALQYALEYSELPADAWIVHLDEETQPTSSGIKGIAKMIAEEEASGRLRVGQGPILYHRSWEKHPFLTLADNLRTGDDFARFHFQYRLGITIFGLHGSYIVCRNDVEKVVGFDFGPQGSITEDAFWALLIMQSGRRARWCDGYMEEQSTQSVGDFIRQRRRWFQGLMKVALYAPVKLRWRLSLGLNTLLWACAPLAVVYSVLHLFYGIEVRSWIQTIGNPAFASFITLYLLGLKANMDEHGITGFWRRTYWTVLQFILIPVFSLLEAAGVLMGIVRPVEGFHVVEK